MTNTPDGQLAFLERDKHPASGWSYLIMIGHIEIGRINQPNLSERTIHGFFLDRAGRIVLNGFLYDESSDPDADAFRYFDTGSITSMARSAVWPVANASVSPVGAGGFVIRRCRMPRHHPNGRNFLVFGVLSTPTDTVETRRIYEVTANAGGFHVANPKPEQLLETTGLALPQYYELPIWGFGDEPLSIPSTLSLEILDQLTQLNTYRLRIEKGEFLQGMDATHYKTLREGPLADIIRLHESGNDPNSIDYLRFQRELRRRYGVWDMSYPVSASELAKRNDEARAVIEDLFPQ